MLAIGGVGLIGFALIEYALNANQRAYDERVRKGETNSVNIKRVKVGMSLYEAMRIMGKPNTVNCYPPTGPILESKPSICQYTYLPLMNESQPIVIKVDSAQNVIDIYN